MQSVPCLHATNDNKSEYIHYAGFCCLEKKGGIWEINPPILLPFNIFFFHFKLQNLKFEAFKETEISFVAFLIVNFYNVPLETTLHKARLLNESFLRGHLKTLHGFSLHERASVECTKNKRLPHIGQAEQPG